MYLPARSAFFERDESRSERVLKSNLMISGPKGAESSCLWIARVDNKVLYKAIGQGTTLEVDFYLQSLPTNSCLLLCSDGLWGFIEEEVMAAIVRETPTPQEACYQLVREANACGGEDNITVILVQVKG